MSAASWWDHYGPAACVATFTLGFVLSYVIWLINYLQMERRMKEKVEWLKEDVAFWRVHAEGRVRPPMVLDMRPEGSEKEPS